MAAKKKSTPKKKHKKMAKRRKNPRTIKSSRPRVLTPENCKRKTASVLMSAIKKAKRGHKRTPKRIGNCTKQSASVALHQTPVRGLESKKGSTYGGQDYKGPKNAKKVLKERAKTLARTQSSKSRSKSRSRAAMRSNPTSGPSLVSWFWSNKWE
jgi:hypothetical protein